MQRAMEARRDGVDLTKQVTEQPPGQHVALPIGEKSVELSQIGSRGVSQMLRTSRPAVERPFAMR